MLRKSHGRPVLKFSSCEKLRRPIPISPLNALEGKLTEHEQPILGHTWQLEPGRAYAGKGPAPTKTRLPTSSNDKNIKTNPNFAGGKDT